MRAAVRLLAAVSAAWSGAGAQDFVLLHQKVNLGTGTVGLPLSAFKENSHGKASRPPARSRPYSL